MSRYIATHPLFIGRARAANPGDEVPEASVEKHGWADRVERVDDDDQADETPTVKQVKQVLADVGNDPDKAIAALEAEQARGDDARPTLVEKLQSIVTQTGV